MLYQEAFTGADIQFPGKRTPDMDGFMYPRHRPRRRIMRLVQEAHIRNQPTDNQPVRIEYGNDGGFTRTVMRIYGAFLKS